MKASEKRLASVAGVVVALMAGLILAKQFHAWQKSLTHREELLSEEREMSTAMLEEAPVWDARQAWLSQHQPVAKSDLQADDESFEPLLQKAKGLGLTVEQKQFQEQTQSEFWHQCGANLTVTGPLPLVFRWIYSVQSPTEFRVVPSLKIVPLKDHPEQVTCSIQFWRWYQPMVAASASSNP
jgi:hypothetical protein